MPIAAISDLIHQRAVEPDDMQPILDNWRKWARQRSWSSAVRAKSIEHRWRSPQTWHPEAPRKDLRELEAWAVEGQWAQMPRQPVNLKDAIKFGVVWGEPYYVVCRRIYVHRSRFDEIMGEAMADLRNRLTLAGILPINATD